MQRHDRHGVGLAAAVGVHHERDVLEEALQVLELLHGADQLLEVLEPAGSVGGAVLLPHLGVAGLVEHDLGELGVGERVALRPPAFERGEEVAQRLARLRLQLVGLDDGAGRGHQGFAAGAGVVVQRFDGGVAEPALRAR